jgi:hypothetical protein
VSSTAELSGSAVQAASATFDAQLALLQQFITARSSIVDGIEQILNCQKKPLDYQQDARLLGQQFKACFFARPTLTAEQRRLEDQLEQAHWDSGLKPRANPGNDIIDPVQMLIRALHLWRQTRWPGGKGRLRYAHTLFNLYLLRRLTLLTQRLWDGLSEAELTPAEGSARASDAACALVRTRLAALQAVLAELWREAPADQPRLVRDVRWLIPVALSPTTDDLRGYFAVATRIANTFDMADRVETQRAWVQSGAGHLCAQLRHLSVERKVPLDDLPLVLLTRRSNALDVTLLMEGLVTLFEAYEQALQGSDEAARLQLAQAICQGISPDPELFLLRLDLLGPYTMIEYLFTSTAAAGQGQYTAFGARHLRLLQEYRARLQRVAPALLQDSRRCRPDAEGYSPYGALYGFASNLLELMALRTLLPEAAAPWGIEDVFARGDAARRQWVHTWRRLPHVRAEVAQQYDYPQDFVEALQARIERCLERCVAAETAPACGRLLLGAAAGTAQALPPEYLLSSSAALLASGQATQQDEDDLLHCRVEGEFLVSWQLDSGWAGLSKDLLTTLLGQGSDIRIDILPPEAAAVLALMCPGLVETVA